MVKFEEQESQERSAEKDASLIRSTCSDLRKLFEEIAELKKLNTEKVGRYIRKQLTKASKLSLI